MFCIHYINMWYLSSLNNSIHCIGILEDCSLRPSSICSCGSARSILNAQLFLYVVFFFQSDFLRIVQLYWYLRLCTLSHPFYAWCCCIFLRILMYAIVQIWNLFLGARYYRAWEELYWNYPPVSETMDYLHRRIWVLQENSSISYHFQMMY